MAAGGSLDTLRRSFEGRGKLALTARLLGGVVQRFGRRRAKPVAPPEKDCSNQQRS